MNGEALPREHGFPARMVVPGLYGFISAAKWLTRMTLTTYAEQEAYWTERDWATDAPIKLSSRIDTPKVARDHRRRRHRHRRRRLGPAAGGVAKVAGADRRRRLAAGQLGPDGGNDYWRQWYLPWTAEPGSAHARRPRRRPATARCRPPPAPTRSPRAPAASRRSSSTSADDSANPSCAGTNPAPGPRPNTTVRPSTEGTPP